MAHPLQAFVTEAFNNYCDQLVKIIFPEKIYLLAARKEHLLQHNIFIDEGRQISSHHYLVLVIYDQKTHDRYILQSRLADTMVPDCSAHPLLLSTNEFERMCKEGHPFAHAVLKNALPCYDAKVSSFIINDEVLLSNFSREQLSIFLRSRESLVFANNAASRNDSVRAVANLHQATTQAFVAIIHHFTGFDYPSSNLKVLHGITQFFTPGLKSTDMLSPPLVEKLQIASNKIRMNDASITRDELSTLFPPITNLVNLCQRLIQFCPSSTGSQL